jgi:cell wall teichoic acid glycosylation protein gtcA
MLDKISYYIKKYEGVILYLIFGILTTLVNFAAYHICYTKLQFPNLVSNTIAWILSVLFAFITNKIWVFKSKSFGLSKLAQELFAFVTARLFTGFLDTAIMFVGVDVLKQNWIIAKIVSSVVVVILNYIFSKLFVFRKNKE